MILLSHIIFLLNKYLINLQIILVSQKICKLLHYFFFLDIIIIKERFYGVHKKNKIILLKHKI